MRTQILTTILGSLIALSWQSGELRELSHNLEHIEEVVLELEGEVEINTWNKRELLVEYEVKKRGAVLGFSNKDSRGDYVLKKREGGNVLIVSPERRDGLRAIGVVTYNETQHHVIYLPEDLAVTLRSKRGSIRINGDFNKLEVESAKELIGRFRREAINSLTCRADDKKLLINGDKKGKNYELTGVGQGVYRITAKRIRLAIN